MVFARPDDFPTGEGQDKMLSVLWSKWCLFYGKVVRSLGGLIAYPILRLPGGNWRLVPAVALWLGTFALFLQLQHRLVDVSPALIVPCWLLAWFHGNVFGTVGYLTYNDTLAKREEA